MSLPSPGKLNALLCLDLAVLLDVDMLVCLQSANFVLWELNSVAEPRQLCWSAL